MYSGLEYLAILSSISAYSGMTTTESVEDELTPPLRECRIGKGLNERKSMGVPEERWIVTHLVGSDLLMAILE